MPLGHAPTGLPLVLLVILTHYEQQWNRPVTSDELAWSIHPLASLDAVDAALAALAAGRYVAPVRDGWHCLVELDDLA